MRSLAARRVVVLPSGTLETEYPRGGGIPGFIPQGLANPRSCLSTLHRDQLGRVFDEDYEASLWLDWHFLHESEMALFFRVHAEVCSKKRLA
jgi:hypothetical protein